jgi:hypothetical protein
MVLDVRRRRRRPTMPAADLKQGNKGLQGIFIHLVGRDRDRPGPVRYHFAADGPFLFQTSLGGNRGRDSGAS